jgi:hypothetical protein
MSSKLQIDQGGNMGKILDYANNKKELDNLISDETRRLCLEGLSYQAALRQAKEIFIKEATKDTGK